MTTEHKPHSIPWQRTLAGLADDHVLEFGDTRGEDLTVGDFRRLEEQLEATQEQLRISYPMTPVDCFISEVRDHLEQNLQPDGYTLSQFRERVAQFRNEVSSPADKPKHGYLGCDCSDCSPATSSEEVQSSSRAKLGAATAGASATSSEAPDPASESGALRCPVCEGIDWPGLIHNPEAPYCSQASNTDSEPKA